MAGPYTPPEITTKLLKPAPRRQVRPLGAFLAGIILGIVCGAGLVFFLVTLEGQSTLMGLPLMRLPFQPPRQEGIQQSGGQETAVPPGGMQVIISKAVVNHRVASLTQQDFVDTQVDFAPPAMILVTTGIPIGPANMLTVRPTIAMQLSTAGQQIDLHIVDVKLAGFNVPLSLIQSQVTGIEQDLETQVNASVSPTLQSANLHLSGIHTTDENLILDLEEAP